MPDRRRIGKQRHERHGEREQQLLYDQQLGCFVAARPPQPLLVASQDMPAEHIHRLGDITHDPRERTCRQLAFSARHAYLQAWPPPRANMHNQEQTPGDEAQRGEEQCGGHERTPVRRGSGTRPSRRIIR